jgi:hypothetical protein
MAQVLAESVSVSAWAVLAQLACSPVWDGDLVSKEGRTELIRLGLAQRIRRDECGFAINELTEEGKCLALNLHTGPVGNA